MTGVQVLVLIFNAGLYAMWASALAFAIQGSRRTMVATILLSAVGSLNGFTIVFCLPPCAFPVGGRNFFPHAPGTMFWFNLKKLVGSYFSFRMVNRSNWLPNSLRINSEPSSWKPAKFR